MEHPPQRTYYVVFAALVALLAVTVVAAEFDLGRAGFLVAVMIASVKAVLILLYFMHVRYSRPLTWLFAGSAFFWIAILFGLTLADYDTRGMLDGAADSAAASERGTSNARTQRHRDAKGG